MPTRMPQPGFHWAKSRKLLLLVACQHGCCDCSVWSQLENISTVEEQITEGAEGFSLLCVCVCVCLQQLFLDTRAHTGCGAATWSGFKCCCCSSLIAADAPKPEKLLVTLQLILFLHMKDMSCKKNTKKTQLNPKEFSLKWMKSCFHQFSIIIITIIILYSKSLSLAPLLWLLVYNKYNKLRINIGINCLVVFSRKTCCLQQL